jgi:Tripartite tricarboxylate transporter TctB family
MMRTFGSREKDLIGGALTVALGAFAIDKGATYQIGTMTRMGPGFFPVALGAILVLAGLAIAGSALTIPASGQNRGRWMVEVRGRVCIVLSVIAFVLFGHHGGLVPATFAVVFIAALGDRRNSPMNAAILAIGVVLVCVAVFHWALQIQFPLFAWSTDLS